MSQSHWIDPCPKDYYLILVNDEYWSCPASFDVTVVTNLIAGGMPPAEIHGLKKVDMKADILVEKKKIDKKDSKGVQIDQGSIQRAKSTNNIKQTETKIKQASNLCRGCDRCLAGSTGGGWICIQDHHEVKGNNKSCILAGKELSGNYSDFGGRIDAKDTSIDEAIAREAREETGGGIRLDAVTIAKMPKVSFGKGRHRYVAAFDFRVTKFTMISRRHCKPNDEITEFMWFPLATADPNKTEWIGIDGKMHRVSLRLRLAIQTARENKIL